MKKILFTAYLAMVSILTVSAQSSIVALHHDGNVTLYSGSETQRAMDASVKGDTLYLSEGVFAGFNVTHGIVVIGAGENTIVSGNTTITGNDENKDLEGYTFSNINFIHDFVVDDSVTGLNMLQCQMNNFEVKEGKFLDAGAMAMCYVKNDFRLTPTIVGLEVLNSKIKAVISGGKALGAVKFHNCNCRNITSNSSGTNNTYINCIMYYANASTFINCVYEADSSPTLVNCWRYNSSLLDDDLNSIFSDEELIEKGYIGTDGTVVGITGGEMPYTQTPFIMHVVGHTFEVDNVNHTLKAILKMSGNTTENDE